MRRGVDRFVVRRGLAVQDPGVLTKFRMIEQLLTVALFFVGLALAFVIVDYEPLRRLALGMFASASLAGIILGLAAQTTVANLVSGVVIAFVQPLRLGDLVMVSEEQGVVEAIGLFYTQIRTWDNRRVVIPNKVLSNEVIRNHSLADPATPAVFEVRVEPGVDVERVRSWLAEEASALEGALAQPSPRAVVVGADDKGTSLQVAVWGPDYRAAGRLATALGERGMARLAREEVPTVGYRLEPSPAGTAGL
jgi:small-conductance mechanosensitive channel